MSSPLTSDTHVGLQGKDELRAGIDQGIGGAVLDPVAEWLRIENSLLAVQLGISVAEAAVREVLFGGPRVLGPRLKVER